MSVLIPINYNSVTKPGRSALLAVVGGLISFQEQESPIELNPTNDATTTNNTVITTTTCSLPTSFLTNTLSNPIGSNSASESDFDPCAYWHVSLITPESFKFRVECKNLHSAGWVPDDEYPGTRRKLYSRIVRIPNEPAGNGSLICTEMYQLHAMSLKEKQEFFSTFPGAMQPSQVVNLFNSAHSVRRDDRLRYVVKNLCRIYFSDVIGRNIIPGAMSKSREQEMISDYLTEPQLDQSCLDPDVLARQVGDGKYLLRRWNVLSAEAIPDRKTKYVFVKSFDSELKFEDDWQDWEKEETRNLDGIDHSMVTRQFTFTKTKRPAPDSDCVCNGFVCDLYNTLKTTLDWWKYPQRRSDIRNMLFHFEKNDLNLLRLAISLEGEDIKTGFGMLRELCLQKFALDHYDSVVLYDLEKTELEISVWSLKRTIQDLTGYDDLSY